MSTVLLLGGTGRTGGRVLEQLLSRGIAVRAIVRSADRLPAGVATNPALAVSEADILDLSDDDLRRHVEGCDAVISCLGHTVSLRGVFGPPHDLVTRAVTRACAAIESLRPAEPVKVIVMSSVSVNGPGHSDTRRGKLEQAFLRALRGLVPPARDNQSVVDHLRGEVGARDAFIRWVAVRPDTLTDGDVSEYALSEGPVSSLARPDSTNMANVADFMCALVEQPVLFDRWAGKLPVIVNAIPSER